MSLLTSAISLASVASALSPITIKGNAFYNGSSDDRFYIKGVDYQPGGSSNLTDPLADPDVCKRDIEHFTDLGVNTIRVYTIDNSKDHDECMEALEKAGIYLILDVNTPKQSLNRQNNDTLAVSYNSGYLQHIFATIDCFKDYPNTLGFFAANEVINNANTTVAAPYIKSVVRDMKAYIKNQANRTIPVGYSAADIADNRWQQMQYLNCGDDDSSRIDFFGMNDYSWCGSSSSFEISGWSQNMQTYKNYTVPLFLSEYGCNKQTPRTFPEVDTLFSSKMSSLYSGGLVYEYSNEANDYGLVDINGDSVSERQDYDNFKKALAKADIPSGDGGAKSSGGASNCPPYDGDLWDVQPDASIPPMPSYAHKYLKNGAGQGKGFDGPDTQNGSDLDNNNNSDSSSSSSSSGGSSSGGSSSTSGSSGSSGSGSASATGSGATKGAGSNASASGSASGSSSSSSKKKNDAPIGAPNAIMGLAALLYSLL